MREIDFVKGIFHRSEEFTFGKFMHDIFQKNAVIIEGERRVGKTYSLMHMAFSSMKTFGIKMAYVTRDKNSSDIARGIFEKMLREKATNFLSDGNTVKDKTHPAEIDFRSVYDFNPNIAAFMYDIILVDDANYVPTDIIFEIFSACYKKSFLVIAGTPAKIGKDKNTWAWLCNHPRVKVIKLIPEQKKEESFKKQADEPNKQKKYEEFDLDKYLTDLINSTIKDKKKELAKKKENVSLDELIAEISNGKNKYKTTVVLLDDMPHNPLFPFIIH